MCTFRNFLLLILFTSINSSCSNEKVIILNGDKKEQSENDDIQNLSNYIPISSMLVGNNVWYKNPSDQVWELTSQSGVRSLRIGGNGYNDNMPSNSELIDWVKRIQQMGAEPIMQVSQHDPASAAAELVELFNKDLITGKPIKYWNIGNEPWLEFNRPPTSEVAALVAPYFKERAAAMKEVDPTIKIYGPDFAYYIEDAIDDLFGGENNIAGKVPGKEYYYCDGISWHRYPQDEASNRDLAYTGLAEFESSIIKCKEKVDEINKKLDRKGDNALGWGLGEFNAKNGTWVHNWSNGQMFAGILNLCMKYEATYATTWSMYENGGSRSGTDYSFIDGNMTPRATYRHMQMIAQNFNGLYAKGNSSTSRLIVFGSINDNRYSVMIINRSDDEINYNLLLNGSEIPRENNVVRLNVYANSDFSLEYTIGPQTTQTIVFENNEILLTSYNETNFNNGNPPTSEKL